MLSGQMSNEDEDEVEDELAALERETSGVVNLPDAPSLTQNELPDAPKVTPKERIEARRREQAAREAGLIAA